MMKQLQPLGLFGLLSLLLWGCGGSNEPAGGTNQFSDATLREVYDLQDRREGTALMRYLTDSNPAPVRKAAALAYGSVQDGTAVPPLTMVMASDKEVEVRKAAAYALGQTHERASAIELANALVMEQNAEVRATQLEAWGKCADSLSFIGLASYNTTDVTTEVGQAWGIYRGGVKGLYNPAAVAKVLGWLESGNEALQEPAAHYLARTRGLALEGEDFDKLKAIDLTAMPDRIAAQAMTGIGKALGAAEAAGSELEKSAELMTYFANEAYGPLVLISALRQFAPEDPAANNFIADLLFHEDPNVAVEAANAINRNPSAENEHWAWFTKDKTKRSKLAPRVEGILWAALLKATDDKEGVSRQIKEAYSSSDDVYFRAQLLTALATQMGHYEYVAEQTFAMIHPAITTAGVAGLASLAASEDFPEDQRETFALLMKRAIETKDMAAMFYAAIELRSADRDYRPFFGDVAWLEAARDGLALPLEMEAYLELQKTLDHFNGVESAETPQNPYNNPIDWEHIATIAANAQAQVKTSKGTITFDLKVDESPASTSNFVKLVQQGFFNGKTFHRVVPNFVAQGGCPRGDGFGGVEYSIRSELGPQRYTTGAVGMASAGKDTEGCQWFITHSPTPHLDGRYSIFAYVSQGMDVVEQLEVGDEIAEVTLTLQP